jgi:hypothetical protein
MTDCKLASANPPGGAAKSVAADCGGACGCVGRGNVSSSMPVDKHTQSHHDQLRYCDQKRMTGRQACGGCCCCCCCCCCVASLWHFDHIYSTALQYVYYRWRPSVLSCAVVCCAVLCCGYLAAPRMILAHPLRSQAKMQMNPQTATIDLCMYARNQA